VLEPPPDLDKEIEDAKGSWDQFLSCVWHDVRHFCLKNCGNRIVNARIGKVGINKFKSPFMMLGLLSSYRDSLTRYLG
jgi:hypothetical protein